VPALGGEGLERRIASFGFHPRWSPDSSQILFQTNYYSEFTRFDVVSLDGSQPHEVLTKFLAQHQLFTRSAAWHPDGKRISLWHGVGARSHLLDSTNCGGEGVRSEIDPQIVIQLSEVSVGLNDETWRDIKFSWTPSGRPSISSARFEGQKSLEDDG